MSRPITQLELRAIRRLLKSGARHIEIARELDLSVTTIERIASDRLLRYRREVPDDELPEDDPPPGYVAANLRRCMKCGAMVYLWPCLTCRMIETQPLPDSRRLAPRDEEDEPLVPTLCVGTQERTLCVRHRELQTNDEHAERAEMGSHAERGNQFDIEQLRTRS